MKIWYLAAGDSVHSYRWIKFFADRGHDIRWLSLVPSMEQARHLGARDVTSPGFKLLRIARAALVAREMLRAGGPDVLHAHYAGAYGVVAALTGFHPMVLTAWGSDVLVAGRSPAAGPFVRYALARADLITVDAQHMVDSLAGFDVPHDRIRLVYFGTDTGVFRPDARNERLRSRVGTPIVISLRNFEPVYDVGTLIRAVPAVVRAVPSVRFLVAGRGTLDASLRSLAQSLGIADHVEFLGHVAPEGLPVYLASADVYVSTALSDAGLAASTAEAMASGLPVVVTDSGENRVWITDCENGFIVPPRDPEELARRIVHLLRHPDIRARWGAINRSMIAERNDYVREMGKMEEIYRTIAAHGRPSDD